MTTAAQLQSIASTLETYRTHLAAVSHALGALRLVSEQLLRDLERDRSALATHIEHVATAPALPDHELHLVEAAETQAAVTLENKPQPDSAPVHSHAPAPLEPATEPPASAGRISPPDIRSAASNVVDVPPAEPASNVISLDARREKRSSGTIRGRAALLVTALLISASAIFGAWEFTHAGLMHQLNHQTACEIGTMPVSSECAQAGWVQI